MSVIKQVEAFLSFKNVELIIYWWSYKWTPLILNLIILLTSCTVSRWLVFAFSRVILYTYSQFKIFIDVHKLLVKYKMTYGICRFTHLRHFVSIPSKIKDLRGSGWQVLHLFTLLMYSPQYRQFFSHNSQFGQFR